eukprot:GFUD01013402.1.p2 GENE.GFUD01013402.1~~GFUD01013402.1.p2  ORF type:complete len:125 (+),score=25.46 GFUD01013402.1:1102-1476(+)
MHHNCYYCEEKNNEDEGAIQVLVKSANLQFYKRRKSDLKCDPSNSSHIETCLGMLPESARQSIILKQLLLFNPEQSKRPVQHLKTSYSPDTAGEGNVLNRKKNHSMTSKPGRYRLTFQVMMMLK